MPLLALCGIILYGTTQASQPAIDPPPVQMGPDRMEIGPDRPAFDQASAPRSTSPPAPPPAPRLRSNEEVEVEGAEPEPSDSAAAADRAVSSEGGTPETSTVWGDVNADLTSMSVGGGN